MKLCRLNLMSESLNERSMFAASACSGVTVESGAASWKPNQEDSDATDVLGKTVAPSVAGATCAMAEDAISNANNGNIERLGDMSF